MATIISALFSFSRPELAQYIRLMQLEKTTTSPPPHHPPELSDLNLAVHQHLRPLTYWSAGVRALADLANHKGSYYHLPNSHARLAFSKRLFLLLRRFIAG
jgi:hypothetical protein